MKHMCPFLLGIVLNIRLTLWMRTDRFNKDKYFANRLCFSSPRLTNPVQFLIFPFMMTPSHFQSPPLSIENSFVTDFAELFEAKGICNIQKQVYFVQYGRSVTSLRYGATCFLCGIGEAARDVAEKRSFMRLNFGDER